MAASITSSRAPLPVCLGNGNPNRLVSLWDIVKRFPMVDLVVALSDLDIMEGSCRRVLAERQGGAFASETSIKYARDIALPRIVAMCNSAGFKAAADAAEEFHSTLPEEKRGPYTYPDASTFYTHLTQLTRLLRKDVAESLYVQISTERADYAFQKHLFGPQVLRAFPEAAYDLREAGNCFAVDANTAAIFHLMRVAEHGLRALAYDRRVKVPKGPIELATWEDIIKQLESAEAAIQGYPKTTAREAQFKFYHGAMMELRSFKNVWRNVYMHTRGFNNEDDERREADRAMHRVRDFMQILASRIGERKRTPLIWKRA